MTLKNFTFLLCVLPIFIGCKTKAEIPPKKPNVVFILVDDLGLMDLGFTGSKYYETPNIDRLAKEGMVFTQGYAASRVCSPSRASIMTGKFTARHGITDWIGAPSGTDWRKMNRHDKLLPAAYNHSMAKEEVTLAEAMKNAGYKTFYAGKWHLGGEGNLPADHGFDINKGGFHSGSPLGGFFSPFSNPALEDKENGENLSMRLAKETVNFIKDHKEENFFAFLSFYAVHAPIQTTQQKWEKYREKAVAQGVANNGYAMERVLPIRQEQDNPIYTGLVESMDDAVGEVLNSLKELGLDKNTIVVFTSDNGGVASGDNFSTANLPLRGGKGYQWEGGIREPYVIKVPWLAQEGAILDTPVSGTDFYPTILDLANIDLSPDQHVDGVSLKPLMQGKAIADRPLFWHYPHYGNQGGNPSSIIQENGWKLIHYWEDGSKELYHLASDIGEQNNLVEKESARAQELSEKLLSWLTAVNANKPEIDPEYKEELAQKRYQRTVEKTLPYLEKERLQLLSPDFKPNADWWGSKVTED